MSQVWIFYICQKTTFLILRGLLLCTFYVRMKIELSLAKKKNFISYWYFTIFFTIDSNCVSWYLHKLWGHRGKGEVAGIFWGQVPCCYLYSLCSSCVEVSVTFPFTNNVFLSAWEKNPLPLIFIILYRKWSYTILGRSARYDWYCCVIIEYFRQHQHNVGPTAISVGKIGNTCQPKPSVGPKKWGQQLNLLWPKAYFN